MAVKTYKSTLTDNAITLLKKRYLQPNEDIAGMWMRVAGGDLEFAKMMENLDFLPNSPTLMNAGTDHKGTLSACFKFDVDDTMIDGPDSIMATATKAASVAKWGGGVGYALSNLRAKDAPIQSVHRKACGPVGVLRFYNEIGRLVTQGGKRQLAQMGILGCWHPDIEEFIHCKDADPQGLATFNISVAATDAFMASSLIEGTKEFKLWKEICKSAWRTGDPGLYFIDIAERTNPTPWLGTLTGTNPCGEVPLLNNEACNLGSINLANHVTTDREVDWTRLRYTTDKATRFLDNILDRNTFPHPLISEAVAKTRKLGLGVMGWADMLALMEIHYDTDEAVELGEQIMLFIQSVSHATSRALAKEKGGVYPGSQGKDDRRNSTCTCIAPTGSISIIAGASSGVEPHFALEWERTMGDGTKLQERVPVWEWLYGFVPKTAMEIGWEWHVKHQAAFQKGTDLACSKTINLPNSATEEDISRAYRMMYDLGCKGGTIFRDGCREGGEQVLKVKDDKKTSVAVNTQSPSKEKSCRVRLPDDRPSHCHKFSFGGVEGYLHVGLYPDGTVGEVFVRVSKEGSTVSGLLDAWAKQTSISLQQGMTVSDLVKAYAGTRFEPCGMTHNKELPITTSPLDYIVRYLDLKFGSGANKSGSHYSGMQCPDCGKSAVYEGGCLSCSDKSCGWSRCG